MPSDYFAVLAQHSAWVNLRLYNACESSTPAEYLHERASTYGSLHATLNHVLVTDRRSIAPIEGHMLPPADEHQISYADLVANRHGDRFETPLRFLLGHLSDGQSRCRGEAVALPAQAGARAPALDLIAFLCETRAAAGR